MTRRLTGASFSPRSRPSSVPIGHLSNKSTVCSPVSMSHMSQDLVQNHMKSHYQRISSAKACVDTSPPKCLKLIVKEKDRKRRETLQRSTTPRPPSQVNYRKSEDKRQDLRSIHGPSYNNNDSILKDSFEDDRTPRVLQSNRTERNGEPFDNTESTWRNELYKNDSRDINGHDINGYTQYERTDRTHTLTNNINHRSGEINHNISDRELDRQVYTSTPRLGNEHRHFAEDAQLQMSRISFSYKEPPSTAKKTKKQRSQEVIWTEEQKYLNFISEVTDDVLARGIFSNRVLNRVFESHIEKNREELDEEHMREMIDQLKEDLGITN